MGGGAELNICGSGTIAVSSGSASCASGWSSGSGSPTRRGFHGERFGGGALLWRTRARSDLCGDSGMSGAESRRNCLPGSESQYDRDRSCSSSSLRVMYFFSMPDCLSAISSSSSSPSSSCCPSGGFCAAACSGASTISTASAPSGAATAPSATSSGTRPSSASVVAAAGVGAAVRRARSSARRRSTCRWWLNASIVKSCTKAGSGSTTTGSGGGVGGSPFFFFFFTSVFSFCFLGFSGGFITARLLASCSASHCRYCPRVPWNLTRSCSESGG
mmetsp:Transcript_69431/g.180872  ORF Transcript_69431/g.180872 Transcript_69431/m.180872 type:complete len:274 (-) Transcript_69431:382-1203(-)